MIRQYQGSPRVSEAATSFFFLINTSFCHLSVSRKENNRVDIVSSVCLLSTGWLSG